MKPGIAYECGFDRDSHFDIRLFAQLAEMEARNFWHRARNKLIIWALKKYFGRAGNFFEIGCGTGFVLQGVRQACPGLKLAGSEIYSEAFQYTRRRAPDAELCQMDARHIPFRDAYDVIGAFDVIEHVEEDELVLSQMFQAARPGGGILLTVPQHPFLWSQYDVRACHRRRYEAGDLKAKIKRAGFRLVRITSFVTLLLPAMMLSRYWYRKPDPAYGVMTELDKKGAVNTLLEKILDIERWLIRAGACLPVGGSLLAVATKS